MNYWRIVVVVTAVLSWTVSPVRAQGPLTPPGAPGETMKTLAQVEPRIPIPGGSSPFTINQQGSYYLVTNMFRTLTIAANNVTVDLMGYRIAASSGDAIEISPSNTGTNTLIRNGTLRPGSGMVALDGRYADDCVFEDLRIEGNNAWCGIYADDRCLVRNCEVRGCDDRGIAMGKDSEVRDCRVFGGTLDGIQAESGCRIVDNVIEDHGDDGLYITGSGCYVAGNRVKSNADNYDLAQGNQLNLLICEVPESLDWPCSAKLAGTLTCSVTGTNGITVNASDVSIDLDGHALIGPGANSGSGVYQPYGHMNLKVCNGSILNWMGTPGGTEAGIRALDNNAFISLIRADTNNIAIEVGLGANVSDCIVRSSERYGIRTGDASTIARCTAMFNDSYGIDAGTGSTVHDCAALRNGTGISVGGDGLVVGCTAYNGMGDGFYLGSRSQIIDCTASGNSDDGIQVVDDCLVRGNLCTDNSQAGIRTTSNNRIDSNHVTRNATGIDVNGNDNLVVRNSAEDNTTDYSIVVGNSDAQVLAPGSGFTSTDPWANFRL